MAIYKITNTQDGMTYIGQTVRSVYRRWMEHCYAAWDSGRIGCAYLTKAIRIHGADQFRVDVIEVCESIEQLNEREIYWIKESNSTVPDGYNIHSGGNRKRMPTLSVETKNRMSASAIGRKKKLCHINKAATTNRLRGFVKVAISVGSRAGLRKLEGTYGVVVPSSGVGRKKPAGFGETISKVRRKTEFLKACSTVGNLLNGQALCHPL